MNAEKKYNTKLEEKKEKASKKDDQEHRVKVNMAKEKNGGQMWMRKELLPREEEKKEVPKPNEKKKKSRGRNPSNRKKM